MDRVEEGPERPSLRRFDSLTSETLSKRISRELLTSILRGEIESGSALPSEEDLASQFDVSRPVVREAVKELAVLGLVESRQGRSTRVTPSDVWNQFAPELLAARSEVGAVDDFLLELLELRRLIETGAAALAAARASEDDIARMTAQFERMETSVGDIERFTDADIAFHDALLDATGNHLLTRLIDMIGPILRFGRIISLERAVGRPVDSQRGHRSVLERSGLGSGGGTPGNARAPELDANLRVDDAVPGQGELSHGSRAGRIGDSSLAAPAADSGPRWPVRLSPRAPGWPAMSRAADGGGRAWPRSRSISAARMGRRWPCGRRRAARRDSTGSSSTPAVQPGGSFDGRRRGPPGSGRSPGPC
jgi:DNA-binding FadR family transcriptional regulator